MCKSASVYLRHDVTSLLVDNSFEKRETFSQPLFVFSGIMLISMAASHRKGASNGP